MDLVKYSTGAEQESKIADRFTFELIVGRYYSFINKLINCVGFVIKIYIIFESQLSYSLKRAINTRPPVNFELILFCFRNELK